MRLPKIALRGALQKREVQLPNPLQSDPVLIDLLQKLNGVSTQDGFNRWKNDFLNRLQNVLDDDNNGDGNDQQQPVSGGGARDEDVQSAWPYVAMSYDNYRKRIDKFVSAVSKVNRHVSGGTLTHTKVSVKARNSLSEIVKQCQGIDDELQVIAPRYSSEEKASGYNRFHLGYIFIKDDFIEYERMNKSLSTLRGLRQQVVNDVADKHLLAQLDEFEKSLERLHATIIIDMGIEGVLWKARMLNPIAAAAAGGHPPTSPTMPDLRKEPAPGTSRSVRSGNSKSTSGRVSRATSVRSGYTGDVDTSVIQSQRVKLRNKKDSPRQDKLLQRKTNDKHVSVASGGGGGRKIEPNMRAKGSSSGTEDSLGLNNSNDGGGDGAATPQAPRRIKSINTTTGNTTGSGTPQSPRSPRRIKSLQGSPRRKNSSAGRGRKSSVRPKDSTGSDDSVDEADNPERMRKGRKVSPNEPTNKRQPNPSSAGAGGEEKENDLNIVSGRSILDNVIKMSSSSKNDLSEARKLLSSMDMGEDGATDDTSGEGARPALESSTRVSFATLDSGEAAVNRGVVARPAGAAPLGFSKKDGVSDVKGLVKFSPKKPKKLKKKGWTSMINSDDDDDDNKSVVSIASKNKAKRKGVRATKVRHNSVKKPSNALKTAKTEGLKKNGKQLKGVVKTKSPSLPAKLHNKAERVSAATEPENDIGPVVEDNTRRIASPQHVSVEKGESTVRSPKGKGKGIAAKQALLKCATSGESTASKKKKLRPEAKSFSSSRPEPPLSKRKNKSVSSEVKERPKPVKQTSKLNIQWPPPKASIDTEYSSDASNNSRSSKGSNRGEPVERKKKPRAASEKSNNIMRQKQEDPPVLRKLTKKGSPKVKKKSHWPSLLGAPEDEDDDIDDLSLTFDMALIPDVPIMSKPVSGPADPDPSQASTSSFQPLPSESEDRSITSSPAPVVPTDPLTHPFESVIMSNEFEPDILANDIKSALQTPEEFLKELDGEDDVNLPPNTGRDILDETDQITNQGTNVVDVRSSSKSKQLQSNNPMDSGGLEVDSSLDNQISQPRNKDDDEEERNADERSPVATSTNESLSPRQPGNKLLETNSLLSPIGSPKKRLPGRNLYPWDSVGNSATKSSSPSPCRVSPKTELDAPRRPVDPPQSHDQGADSGKINENALNRHTYSNPEIPKEVLSVSPRSHRLEKHANRVDMTKTTSPTTEIHRSSEHILETIEPHQPHVQHPSLSPVKSGESTPRSRRDMLSAEHGQKMPQLSPMAGGTLGTVDRNRVSQVGVSPPVFESSASNPLMDSSKSEPKTSPKNVEENVEAVVSRTVTSKVTDAASGTVSRIKQGLFAPKAQPAEPKEDASPTRSKLPAFKTQLWNKPVEEAPKPPQSPLRSRLNKEYSWRKKDSGTAPTAGSTRNEDIANQRSLSPDNNMDQQPALLESSARTQDSRAYDKTRDALKKLADSIQVPTPQPQSATETESSDYTEISAMIGSIRNPKADNRSHPWGKKTSLPSLDGLPAKEKKQSIFPFSSDVKEKQSIFPFSSDAKKSYPWNKSGLASKQELPDSKLEKQQSTVPTISGSSTAKKAYPWQKTGVTTKQEPDSTPAETGPSSLKKAYPWQKSGGTSNESKVEERGEAKPSSDLGANSFKKEYPWQKTGRSTFKEKEQRTDIGESSFKKSYPWQKKESAPPKDEHELQTVNTAENSNSPNKVDESSKEVPFGNEQKDQAKSVDTSGDTKSSLLWDKLVDTSKSQAAESKQEGQEQHPQTASIFAASSHHQRSIDIFEDSQHSSKPTVPSSPTTDASSSSMKFKPVSSWSKPSTVDEDELSHPLKKPKDKKVRSAVGVKKTGKPKSGRMKPQHTSDDSSVVKMKKSRQKKRGEMTFTKKATSTITDPTRRKNHTEKARGRGNSLVHKPSQKPWAPDVQAWGRSPFER